MNEFLHSVLDLSHGSETDVSMFFSRFCLCFGTQTYNWCSHV